MSPLILRVGLSPAVRRIKAGWIVIKFYYICAGSCDEVLKRLTCLTCNIKLRFRHTLNSVLFNRVTVDVAFITIQYLITYLPIYFVWKTSNIYEYNNTGSGFTKPRSEIKFCLLGGLNRKCQNFLLTYDCDSTELGGMLSGDQKQNLHLIFLTLDYKLQNLYAFKSLLLVCLYILFKDYTYSSLNETWNQVT